MLIQFPNIKFMNVFRAFYKVSLSSRELIHLSVYMSYISGMRYLEAHRGRGKTILWPGPNPGIF